MTIAQEVAGYVSGTVIVQELLPLAAGEGCVAVDAMALQVMICGPGSGAARALGESDGAHHTLDGQRARSKARCCWT